MKRLMLCVAAIAAFASYADFQDEEPVDPKRAAARARKQREFLKDTGGYVYKIPENPGKFSIVNAQRSLDLDAFKKAMDGLSYFNSILIDAINVSDKVDAVTAEAVFKATGANGAVFIIDDPKYPISIIAPESKWGIVNIAPLRKGAKNDAALKKRASRELWRVFYYVAGAADSDVERCLLRPVFSGNDIEALETNTICPTILPKTELHLKAMGIKQWERATFREACEAGWAPAPTNDFQKVIWAEYNTKPTQPIKIKYDKKKGE